MPLRLSASARLKLTTASAALLALAAPGLAQAQVLSGTVKDSSGEARFEGAIITIEELGRSVATDRFGVFRITNVPEGSYTITTDYVGTPSVSSSIDLPTEGANIDIVIGEDVEYIDNIIVVGTRAAQAGAINQQRASNSIITVIDSDGLGNFPDTTVADSLQRAVGISIETDQGEGRYVSIRGISPDLISASINGVRTPSPEDRRGVLLDGVPSDLLSGIEIQKSLTPDLDADTIGGVINLKTLSAFDRDGQFLSVKAQGRVNEITDNLSGKGTLTYTNTWDDRLGLAVSANYQQLAIEAHNNEVGGWGEDNGTFFINDDYEHRWYDLTRERFGLVGNLDFRATDNTTLYFRSLFNRYEDDEVRNKFEYRAFDDTFDDAFGNGDEDTELASPISSTQSQVALNEVDAEVRKRLEIREIQTYSLGGETTLDSWTFDYEVAYATAEEDDSRNHDVTFRTEDIQEELGATATSPQFLLIDTSTSETPRLSNQAIFDRILNPANFALDELEEEDTINEDEEVSARLNIARDSVMGDVPVTWKAGGKYRDREKIRDVNKIFSEADDVFASEFTDNQLIPGWRLPNPSPAFPDGDLTVALRNGGDSRLEVNDDDTFLESNFEDFTINEQILAAYAMGTFEIDNLTLIAGVRLEQTDVELQGNIVAEEFEDENGNDVAAASTTFTLEDDYTNVLPSVNAKYDFSEKFIGRAAYYSAVVRPAFNEIAPSLFINDDRDGIEMGNTALEPLEADNFDLSFEFYPSELSLISISGFYKSIDNAIFPVEFEIGDAPAGVDLSRIPASILADPGAEVATFINVPDSEIFGVEFNVIQSLDVISPALDGFLFSGNLTLSDSEATLPDGRVVPFLRQSDVVWNAALGYEKGPWDLRVSANYRGDTLDELLEEDLDRIQDDRLLVEASAKYQINDQFQVYVEGKNLTDAPEYYYFGNESRLSQYDEFGRSFIFGVRYTY